MLKYTVRSNDLAEADIYEITPVASLHEFLIPQKSLCIVKTPYEGSIVEMPRITGKDGNGNPVKFYIGIASTNDQGYFKGQLDKMLFSPYLFVSWKQCGHHTFKLFECRKLVAEFPDFESALAAYFPDGFTPEKLYRRKHTVFQLMCMKKKKKKSFKDIVTIIDRWCDKKNKSA